MAPLSLTIPQSLRTNIKCMKPALSLLLCIVGAAQPKHVLKVTPQTVIVGYYDPASPPALRVKSGDQVEIHTLVAGRPRLFEAGGVPANQIQPEHRAVDEAATAKGARGHYLTGPVFIEEAEPGDVLEVKILDVKLALPFAYNSMGAAGVLAEEFEVGKQRIIPLDGKAMLGRFAPGVNVPLKPFFGSMGVAPPKDRVTSRAPGIHAGNLDNKELVAGTSLFIPIHVKGALFQVGDGHAAQGDGEVNVTALETSLTGTFRFVVHKNKTLTLPRGETPDHYIAMGFDEDLTKATKLAVQQAVEFISSEKGLSRADAYMLVSVGVDLRITQLVDGRKGVHAMIPKALFK